MSTVGVEAQWTGPVLTSQKEAFLEHSFFFVCLFVFLQVKFYYVSNTKHSKKRKVIYNI